MKSPSLQAYGSLVKLFLYNLKSYLLSFLKYLMYIINIQLQIFNQFLKLWHVKNHLKTSFNRII